MKSSITRDWAARVAEEARREEGDVPLTAGRPTGEARSGPDFVGFAVSLEEEALWVERIHAGDKTGQATSDAAALRRLKKHVLLLGSRFGFAVSSDDSFVPETSR